MAKNYNNIKSTACKTDGCGCTLFSYTCLDNNDKLIADSHEGLCCNNCGVVKIRKRNTVKVFYRKAVWQYGILMADTYGESLNRISSKFLESIKDEYGFATVIKFDLSTDEIFNVVYSFDTYYGGWYILRSEKTN